VLALGLPWLLSTTLATVSPEGAERGNTVLDRPLGETTYSVAAVGRAAFLIGNGSAVMQPFGFGIAAQLRVHALRLARTRVGLAFHGGYARWSEGQQVLQWGEDGETMERVSVLSVVDLSVGPSLQVPLGPLFVVLDGGVGVGISQFERPLSSRPEHDQQAASADLLLRAGLSLGIPLFRDHGLLVGVEVQQLFSGVRIVSDPAIGDVDPEKNLKVFDLHFSALLGYQRWF